MIGIFVAEHHPPRPRRPRISMLRGIQANMLNCAPGDSIQLTCYIQYLQNGEQDFNIYIRY